MIFRGTEPRATVFAMTRVVNADAAAGRPQPAKPPQPFRVDVHREGAAVRLVPVGELDLATAGELEARLAELEAAKPDEVLLDLRELEFIDSCGVRLIVAADRAASRNGHRFAVISGPPAVQRVLDISGLGERLDVRAA